MNGFNYLQKNAEKLARNGAFFLAGSVISYHDDRGQRSLNYHFRNVKDKRRVLAALEEAGAYVYCL